MVNIIGSFNHKGGTTVPLRGVAAITQSNHKLRVVFMGSDTLSCTFLTALIHAPDMDVLAVVTQPDRERGRRMQIVPGPVKDLALMHCKPVLSPVKVNDPEFLETLRRLAPDVIVVMAYGQFLGKTLLALPPLGCVNLHVSILPRHRGAAPIQYAILQGDRETGVTAMMMDAGMDTGDILGVVRREIRPDDTTGTLSLELVKDGADLMLDVLRDLAAGRTVRIPQDCSCATYAPKISKEQALIEWAEPAALIERKVRALNPKPCCHTFLPAGPAATCAATPGALLKVLRTAVEEPPPPQSDTPPPAPGTVLAMKRGPVIAAGDGLALRLLEVLPEGKPRVMSGQDFANGYSKRLAVGDRLFPGLGVGVGVCASP
ncbi:MAG: methionyl-tRNA formyltransferase [Kiritimatiellia bacterium]|jgi:methionyl-tRNA formyltransferase